MSDKENDPLRVLEREAEPPRLLKGRVLRTLKERGLLRGSGWSVWKRGGAAAAAVAIFTLGLAVGRPDRPAPDPRQAFVLLLYEDSAFRGDRPESEFVAEYGRWAADLARRGALVSGEKLDSTARLLREDGSGVQIETADARSDIGHLTGFFIIRAADQAEALRIAQSCPHLGHGGRIALRPIVPT